MMRASVILCLLLGACGDNASTAPATPATPATPRMTDMKTTKVPMFDDVTIADGAIHLMDGGIHGVQGHTLEIAFDGNAKWARRIDSMQPNGKANAGTLALDANDRQSLAAWSDGLWNLAPQGRASLGAKLDDVPRWVWAIVMRRGNDVRVLSGGDMSPPGSVPEPAKSALAWLIERVDAVSAAAP